MAPEAHFVVDAETSSVSPKPHKIFNACYRSIGNEINIFFKVIVT
jgi:hypothetical protein